MARLRKAYIADVRFRVTGRSTIYLDAFLDMLRYDRCKVVSWRQDGPDYVVTVVKDDTDFTEMRWNSFEMKLGNHRMEHVS